MESLYTTATKNIWIAFFYFMALGLWDRYLTEIPIKSFIIYIAFGFLFGIVIIGQALFESLSTVMTRLYDRGVNILGNNQNN